MRLFKQLLAVFAALAVIVAVLMTFSYDVFKVDWVVFMEIQEAFDDQEKPLAVPAQSIPVDGAAYLPGMGEPINPVPADEASIARGTQLYSLHCAMCHGADARGTGTVGAFLVKKKPSDLTSEVVQAKSDGSWFLTISNGIWNPNNTLFPEVQFSGQCPPLNENLTIRERWDVVNFLRTLKAVE